MSTMPATWIPPEVMFDYHGRQAMAKRDGRPFARYVPCSEGCGYLIGVGDAIDGASHLSCTARTYGPIARCETPWPGWTLVPGEWPHPPTCDCRGMGFLHL